MGTRPVSFLLVMILMGASGCRPKELSSSDYIDYVTNPKNGLLVNEKTDKYEFSLQYKPAEFEWLVQSSEGDTSDKVSRLEDIKQLQYFVLKVRRNDASTDPLSSELQGYGDFQSRLMYLSSEIQKNLKLVEGQDTLPCLFHHFERAYAISPYNTFTLVFAKSKQDKVIEDKVLVIDDDVFNIGRIKLQIDKEDIKNTPSLKEEL